MILWTPQAGYTFGVFCLCIAVAALQAPDPSPPARPATGPAMTGPVPLKAGPYAPRPNTDPPANPDPVEMTPVSSQPESVPCPPIPPCPRPAPCPPSLVLRPAPLVLVGAQATFPLNLTLNVSIRWGRVYVGPVWSIWPQGYGLRVDYPLF